MFPELLLLILFALGIWWAFANLRVSPTQTGSSTENDQHSLWQKVPKIFTQPHLNAHGFSTDQAGTVRTDENSRYARSSLADSSHDKSGIADAVGGNKDRSSGSNYTSSGSGDHESESSQISASEQPDGTQTNDPGGVRDNGSNHQEAGGQASSTQIGEAHSAHASGGRARENQVNSTPPRSAPPGSAQPGSTQPGSTQPGNAQPGSAQPGSTQPGNAQPGSTQPGSAQPGSTQPGSAQPGSTQPGSAQPGSTQTGIAQASSSQSGTTGTGTGTENEPHRPYSRALDSSGDNDRASISDADSAASNTGSSSTGTWASRPVSGANADSPSEGDIAGISAEIANQVELNRQLQARISELENERQNNKESKIEDNNLRQNIEQPRSGQTHVNESQLRPSSRNTDASPGSSNPSAVDEPDFRTLKAQLAIQQQQNEKYLLQIDDLKSRLHANSSTQSTGSSTRKLQDQKSDTAKAERKPLFQRPVEQDDLKQISGIGPVMEKTLNDLGVTTFKQLAEFTSDDVQMVSDALEVFPGRIERDEWVTQAGELYRAKYLSKA